MARPSRKKLAFTEESVNKLLQELYEDSHNQKAKIVRLFSKWEIKIKEGGEIAAIGDQIVKLITAEAKNLDQKIMLLKYLKEVVFVDTAGNKDQKKEEAGNVTTDRRNELLSMVQEHLDLKEEKNNQ